MFTRRRDASFRSDPTSTPWVLDCALIALERNDRVLWAALKLAASQSNELAEFGVDTFKLAPDELERDVATVLNR